jgi:hypothetical protein
VLAHALCRVNRFSGHTKGQLGYSVAQHSLNVMMLLPPHLQLQGLLHDVHEALIGDVSAPLKVLLPDFRALEKRIEAEVHGWFGLPAEFDPLVRRADLWMLHVESIHLMPYPFDPPDSTEGLNMDAPLYLMPRRLSSLKGQFIYHARKLMKNEAS